MAKNGKSQEEKRYLLKIVSQQGYPDGSIIGAGYFDDPELAGKIGVIIKSAQSKTPVQFDGNIADMLILIRVISDAVRHQTQNNLLLGIPSIK